MWGHAHDEYASRSNANSITSPKTRSRTVSKPTKRPKRPRG